MIQYYYNFAAPEDLTTYNVFQEGDKIRAELHLPGVKKKNIDLSFSEEDGGLRVSIKEGPTYFIPVQILIYEDDIEAKLELGILTITMLKKDTSHTIQIK